MATIVQTFTDEGSATQSASGAPPAQVFALTDGEGTLNPTMRSSAGAAAPGQTLQTFTGNPALSASVAITTALFTVPAGKTLYITDIYVSSNGTSPTLVQIQATGTTIFYGYSKGDTGPIEFPGIETQPSASAGQAVTLVLGVTVGAPTAAYYIGSYYQ